VLTVGDTIAVELDAQLVERRVDSMQLDNQPLDRAEPGQLVGIKFELTKYEMSKARNVYRVNLML
jgi:hypothetical protein